VADETFDYEVVTRTPSGTERVHEYARDEPLRTGDVLRLDGRYWLVESVAEGGQPVRAVARPARYRIRLRHPDGRDETGAFRRFRPDAPAVGHSFTTIEEGRPTGWEVVDETVASDDEGAPYLDLVAERDYSEVEEAPDHELEHALAARDRAVEEAAGVLADARSAGLAVELVALEPGELPDWDEAVRYIDALAIEEVGDDLLEESAVRPGQDPRDSWLRIVRDRLLADLQAFRADVETDHDLIEEWEFLDGRVFAAVGRFDDESDPDAPYGWMCRLVDAGALAAAGFRRVRKAELEVAD
jgi:hypothetical protein